MIVSINYSCCAICKYMDTPDNLIDCYTCNEQICSECLYSSEYHQCYDSDYYYSGLNHYHCYYIRCEYCRYLITQGSHDIMPCFICLDCDKTLCEQCIDHTKKKCNQCRQLMNSKELESVISSFDEKIKLSSHNNFGGDYVMVDERSSYEKSDEQMYRVISGIENIKFTNK